MLALLAGFLFFWLHQEYKDEQLALQNEYDLQVAKEIFDMNGIDLNSILTKVRGTSGEVAIKIDVTNEVFENQLDGKPDSNWEQHARMEIHRSALSTDSIIVSDDSIKVVKNFRRSKEMGKDIEEMAIIYATELSNDSMHMLSDSPLSQIIKSDAHVANETIRRQALFNIWPQIVFALLLFTLLTFGIYLLQKSYQEQQLLLENKNNLISNITHELKTPVATIGVALEAIQDFNVKDNPEKANSYIDLSRKELNRLSSSIDQVLQLGKMDDNLQTYQFEKQSINTLIEDVIQHLDLQAQQKNIEIRFDSNTPDAMVELDAPHFKSMLFNLLDNSLKYSPSGSSIHVDLHKNAGQCELKIQDNGIGIEEKYLGQIYERFFRVPHGNQHNVKGYGLGLSYVKEIIDAHQWDIKIDSKVNEGTTVTVKMPTDYV